MKIVRGRSGWLEGALMAAFLLGGTLTDAEAQTPKSTTTMYGSGLITTPVAAAAPHLSLTGTFSGFSVLADEGTPFKGTYTDASVYFGLFDRVELGVTLQDFGDTDSGGSMWGPFGRLVLVRPGDEGGIGLAGGVRYLAEPEFGDEVDREPGRLGFSDPRLLESLGDDTDPELATQWSWYGVATVMLPGDGFLGDNHDWTFNFGWGNGMFEEGEDIPFYASGSSNGFFFGSGLHFGLGDSSMLSFLAEYNGFDTNLGANLNLAGIQLGGYWLAVNQRDDDSDIYLADKFGFLASVCLFGDDSFLCRPSLLDRPMPDTVRLPAPAPDTVRIRVPADEPELPTGTPTDICLATGQAVTVYVTAAGDTLVGPNRVSIRTLRPGVVFAGTYAQGRDWFENDEPITFETRTYNKSGGEVRMQCPNLMRVGEYRGVPLYAQRNATRPFQTLYAPVRPGVWQPYEMGIQRTRGQ